ncbi:hypothetical protein D9611_007926 [Ephemerocybe angulata]|uniref:Uncharacterized protein n=1 Tax=Ephemerocybe angulata TaxID=980116 RepID=A0A8H5CEP2_9AGAR|nr:hypothetical protein D9611_007926 [Tulosesus angulatus]
MPSANASALGPIDPTALEAPNEDEKSAPWVVRKLVGSMTGRIVMSSYESLRAAGTSVICLSPWGDSSPLLLPCIRFRDLAVHTVIVATGGMAAVAAPVMGPVSEAALSSFGDTILVELGLNAGFSLGTKMANDLVFDKPLGKLLPLHDARLETTTVKELTITLKFKLAMEDANLGFFRGSVHSDPSLFSSVKEYLSVDKGWFSPYLFASARRPAIPRSMKPDVVFCHGPFLLGDYRIGETLLAESASVITLCDRPEPVVEEPEDSSSSLAKLKPQLKEHFSSLSDVFKKHSRSRSPSPSPGDSSNTPDPDGAVPPSPSMAPPSPTPYPPRHMVIVVLGLKPHRSLWTTSKRPGESVIRYLLLNGCVSILVPVKPGAPLVAWDVLTLKKLWDIDLPPKVEAGDISESALTETPRTKSGRFEGVVQVMYEYLDLCVDWERVALPGLPDADAAQGGSGAYTTTTIASGFSGDGNAVDLPATPEAKQYERQKEALKDAVTLLVASAVRSGESKAARDDIDEERAGIAMWRIR